MESYKRKGKSHLRLKTKESLDFSTRNYMYKVKISHATPYITDPYLTPWLGAATNFLPPAKDMQLSPGTMKPLGCSYMLILAQLKTSLWELHPE